MTREREFVEAIGDLMAWAARPVESYPGRSPYGKPLPYPPQLRVYGNVTESNVRSGARLMMMYLGDEIRAASKAWAALPADVRRRVAARAAAIRRERLER